MGDILPDSTVRFRPSMGEPMGGRLSRKESQLGVGMEVTVKVRVRVEQRV